MKKKALCPLSGVHLTIKPKFSQTIQLTFHQKCLEKQDFSVTL